MKVTVENKKGLNKDLRVFVDKKTINSYIEQKYEEIKKDVVLKGFRPGKVPKGVLKNQFGKAIFGDVLDKVLKETSTKALQEQKIKPIGQPKIDLKKFGEDKDLEYIISVTEVPKIELKSLEKIKFHEYKVKINDSETDKRIKEIAKSQKNFKDVDPAKIANEGDLVVFDYRATVDGKEFKGGEGKNTQLELGKDLFIKGFDKQLTKCKKGEKINVKVKLPENFPEKEIVGKEAIFECKIISVKKSVDVKIDDEFAKGLGAKDLKDLKELITKQINEQYKNSLDVISKKEILEEIDKIKITEIPKNLLDDEIRILSQGLNEQELSKKKSDIEKNAKKRIKVGLILNEFGEKNNIKVEEQEINLEVQKQLRMMPGQEKMVMEFYKKNPSAMASLRGNLYEEKIINQIKQNAKPIVKELTKEEAEKILKNANDENLKKSLDEERVVNKKENKSKDVKKIKRKPLKKKK